MSDMKRTVCIIISITMLICMLASCMSLPQNGNVGEKTSGENGTNKDGGYNDGVIGGRDPSGYDGDMLPPYADAPKGGDAAYDRDDIFAEPGEAYPADDGGLYPDGNAGPTAGTLTAGEWRDVDDLAGWINQLSDNEWYKLAQGRELHADSIVKVTVRDGDGVLFNAPVELLSGGKVIYSARTGIDGNAYLFYKVNNKTDAPDSVRVAGKTEALDGRNEITLSASGVGNAARSLDLMLMVDTTGSMGDELEYLKVELADMVGRIAGSDETLSIRVSVNFYRDEGDEYIVKYFDFRTDINECIAQIKEQYAMGGGDWPEAVHTALENAVTGHQWRDDAVKICFLVLDAPPHTESEIQGVNASILSSVKKAAQLGIRIIPVASSGVDTETELILRSFAVMTGGTYIFLTNHSGIGGGHIDPTVEGEYDIEPLNECMIRVVCEYCGLTYTPPAEQTPDQQ